MTKPPLSEIGMIGLGVMGRNLLLNMADHGYPVAGYDKDPAKVAALRQEGHNRGIRAAELLPDFIALLQVPRAAMLLVPAGAPVDAVLRDLIPHLAPGDLIVDGGNSHFKDTDLRAQMLAGHGIQFLGVGISGGEHGARHGPSMMPGGSPEAYGRVQAIFEASAAQVDGSPCAAWLGPRSAGHYVKMVHNGIEYGLMQLIAEVYDLMKRGLVRSNDEMADAFERWNRAELSSYLVEITGQILRRVDESTGQRLVDLIADAAEQKGTGMWTSQDAMDLQVPLPIIDAAVTMRNLSAAKADRATASRALLRDIRPLFGDSASLLAQMGEALYAAMILTYAQGLVLLQRASAAHAYELDLEKVARIWRGGCIIRAALLEPIRDAYRARPGLPNLLLDPALGPAVLARQESLRAVVRWAAESGIPAPGLMSALAYFDAYRSAWLPANLIQAQRDFFGAHMYERIDEKGSFHTQWSAA